MIPLTTQLRNTKSAAIRRPWLPTLIPSLFCVSFVFFDLQASWAISRPVADMYLEIMFASLRLQWRFLYFFFCYTISSLFLWRGRSGRRQNRWWTNVSWMVPKNRIPYGRIGRLVKLDASDQSVNFRDLMYSAKYTQIQAPNQIQITVSGAARLTSYPT